MKRPLANYCRKNVAVENEAGKEKVETEGVLYSIRVRAATAHFSLGFTAALPCPLSSLQPL